MVVPNPTPTRALRPYRPTMRQVGTVVAFSLVPAVVESVAQRVAPSLVEALVQQVESLLRDALSQTQAPTPAATLPRGRAHFKRWALGPTLRPPLPPLQVGPGAMRAKKAAKSAANNY